MSDFLTLAASTVMPLSDADYQANARFKKRLPLLPHDKLIESYRLTLTTLNNAAHAFNDELVAQCILTLKAISKELRARGVTSIPEDTPPEEEEWDDAI